jgi:hypothetical protein
MTGENCATGNAGTILLDGAMSRAMDSYLERLQQAIASATRGMTSEELTRHRGEKWSAAEVLEHLYLTYTGTLKGCQRCLEAGRPMVSSPSLKQKLSAALVTDIGYFPKRRKSPKPVCPKGIPVETIIADIGPQLVAMDKLIAQCEARYGAHTRILDHPVLGPLTPRQWRKFHWVHGRHHVKQILERRDMSGTR